MTDVEFACFAGVDWATQKHDVCVVGCDGKVLGRRTFEHSGDGLDELAKWMVEKSVQPEDRVAVAIEVPHGPVVETLLEHGFAVFSINPKQLDRFRDRFSPAGAKDDSRDAHVLADSLRTDRRAFRSLSADDPKVIHLREWTRIHADLTEDRHRQVQRMRHQLQRYYPQILELADDLGAESMLALWELAPNPQQAAYLSEEVLAKLLRRFRLRRFTVQEALATLQKRPLRVAPGVTVAAVDHIRVLVDQIRQTNRRLDEALRTLDQIVASLTPDDSSESEKEGRANELSDVAILKSLPGVGRIVLSTLLAEAARPLAHRDYHSLRTLSGVAPVTVRSGRSLRVQQRYACHHRLREVIYHWARVAVTRDAHWEAGYAALRAKGHSHGRACRTIADRLLRVAIAMLRTRTLYDPTRFRENLEATAA